MRKFKCDKGCSLEPMDYSQSGGEEGNITYMMAAEQDGLTPAEGNYLIPLRQASKAHSQLKRGGRKKRKQVLVGGGRRKTKRGGKKKRARRQPLKRLNQVGFGRRKPKKGRKKSVKRRK